MKKRWVGTLLGLFVLTSLQAGGERLALGHVELDLPGPPSKVIPYDLDRDGDLDLVVVVAYTEFDEISEDRIENMIQFSTVIPAVFDRREIRAWLADGQGGYRPAGAPLPLPPSVLTLEPGPAGLGLVALTDAGLSRLVYDTGAPAGGPLRFEPWIDDPPLLAGTRNFYAELNLVEDLNGDGFADLLLPARDAHVVYLGSEAGLNREAAHRVEVPRREQRYSTQASASIPRPRVSDLDGDGIADLIFGDGYAEGSRAPRQVLLGSPEGRFRPLRPAGPDALDCHDIGSDLRWTPGEAEAYPWPKVLGALVDLDGDGRVEAVLSEYRLRGDSFRKGMKDAKRPIQNFRFHRLDDRLAIEREPYHETEVIGHSMEGGIADDGQGTPIRFDQFRDLDGDGRKDLITITMDFSVFQAVKILATKRISIGFNFHVYAQDEQGRFREVPDLDLSEKLKLDLNNLKVGRFGQFAGDFDGDGRQDFVHLGRGRDVTIHAGGPGCRYPKNPNLTVRLEAEPEGLDLIRVEDLDGDGRADIRVTRPLAEDDPDLTSPVRLDLYLSGAGQ